ERWLDCSAGVCEQVCVAGELIEKPHARGNGRVPTCVRPVAVGEEMVVDFTRRAIESYTGRCGQPRSKRQRVLGVDSDVPYPVSLVACERAMLPGYVLILPVAHRLVGGLKPDGQ